MTGRAPRLVPDCDSYLSPCEPGRIQDELRSGDSPAEDREDLSQIPDEDIADPIAVEVADGGDGKSFPHPGPNGVRSQFSDLALESRGFLVSSIEHTQPLADNDVMRFEWAPEKERANIKKHGLSFEEATTLFTSGKDYLEIYDEKHSEHEDRFIANWPHAKRCHGGRLHDEDGRFDTDQRPFGQEE